MSSRKKSAKPKINSRSLDAYLEPKKALTATDPAEDKLDDPDTPSIRPDPDILTPTSQQRSKRKRADEEPTTDSHRKNTHERNSRRSKGYAPPSTYDHLPPLTDTITPNLFCVFVGLNPGIQTATKGHPYAHPTNLYWYLLHTSGLTPDRRLAPAEYVILPEKYSLGNTNIVSRATKDGSQLSKAEMVDGAGVLDEKIRKWEPEVVCLVGKSIWEAVWKWKHGRGIKKGEFKYGFQDDGEKMGRKKKSGGLFGGKETEEGGSTSSGGRWDGAKVFVATSTSGLAATLSLKEKEEIWAELGRWVNKRREERKGVEREGKEVGGAEKVSVAVSSKE